jgi:hypothetical protein
MLLKYEEWYKRNAFNFFLRKCNCSSSEIYMDDSYIFCNYEAIFQHTLPTLSNTLYTSVVKFPTLILEHIMKTLFQFIVICKMAPT